MDGVPESQASIYGVLLDRFRGLEASHVKLKEQFEVLLQEREEHNVRLQNRDLISDSFDLGELPGWASIPGAYFAGSPYKSVLEHLGHAVYVTRIASGEIIYWNGAAEKLFGYKAYEVVGCMVSEVRLEVEHHLSTQEIMEKLHAGRNWSGQLPLQRRSRQIFLGMVTKSPLYEDGEITGIVSVSSDASIFNNTNSGGMRSYQDHANEQSNTSRINFKKIQWQPQARIAAVPHIATSLSNLASKVLSRRRGDANTNNSTRSVTTENEEVEVESHDLRTDKPPRAPIPRPSTAPRDSQIGASNNSEKIIDQDIQQNGSDHNFRRKDAISEAYYRKGAYQGSFDGHIYANQFPKSSLLPDSKEPCAEDTSPRRSCSPKTSSGENTGSGLESSSSRKSNGLHKVVNSEIRWEDLQLREEIGQGSFAIVYRGVWNGSDVAVKVYYGNQYTENTLLDYKKEIDIMRRLRHPNVLLFMGAVCTEEKLAIVTEYLTRGSLFKTLHKNNQSFDIKRRLKMAIDVARGMNYLHHRNPPIVHRDLKSSNLLVDKSWSVKVGDFGLSKLKHATFLTTKSGRGTPQWMAPEVLRNEPSTEKSDVFSFGVILWELMTESIPWNNLNSLQVVGVVGFMDRRLDIPDNIDPQVASVIMDCWQSNPEDRPSFEDIIHRMTEMVQMGCGLAPRTMSLPQRIRSSD